MSFWARGSSRARLPYVLRYRESIAEGAMENRQDGANPRAEGRGYPARSLLRNSSGESTSRMGALLEPVPVTVMVPKSKIRPRML